MSTSKIVAAVSVIAFSAVPALAGDHNLATELEGSGRYPAQTTVPTDANAWSIKGRTIRHGYSVWPEEFQLQGR
jgi:hypothetical protein